MRAKIVKETIQVGYCVVKGPAAWRGGGISEADRTLTGKRARFIKHGRACVVMMH